MAKDLVRTRTYITKFIEMRSHLQGASLKLQTVKSHQALAESMSSVAKAMIKVNKAVNVPAINKMMQDFARENEKSELMQEMMGDAMDDVMEGNEEEEEQVVNQVLDEIGIKVRLDEGGGAGAKRRQLNTHHISPTTMTNNLPLVASLLAPLLAVQ